MQSHAEIGERILANVDTYGDIARVVRHHHERVDGNGYPDGLTEDDTPLLSRIIAVADAYNAMTSDQSVSRGDAQSRRPDETCPSGGFPIRHDSGGSLRSDPCNSRRGVSSRHQGGLRFLTSPGS